ncbi:hypothetical protein [Peribacillus sp. NPDC097295]|uniref:hypothetical protein n=1 Tax=Peribacillus sp. NPDC097295 TaxID=3364402 RepID=UPI00383099DA
MAIKEDMIVVGKAKYLHKTDEEYDYLMEDSSHKVKVSLTFTKSLEKNDLAKKGLTAFFRGIWS